MLEQKIRESFEKHFNAVLDLTPRKDAWGRDVYKHPHIQSIFEGYRLGYVGLLEDLEQVAYLHESGIITVEDRNYHAGRRSPLYRLPEGIRNEDLTSLHPD